MRYVHLYIKKSLSTTTHSEEEWLKHGVVIKERESYDDSWRLVFDRHPDIKVFRENSKEIDTWKTLEKFKENYSTPPEVLYYCGHAVIPLEFLEAEKNVQGIEILKIIGDENREPVKQSSLIAELLGVILDKWQRKTPDVGMDEQGFFNKKCNTVPARNFLNEVNKVKIKENYCTENLQDELDKGWRILAVCVQPDGRRPDYVLGRVNAENA